MERLCLKNYHNKLLGMNKIKLYYYNNNNNFGDQLNLSVFNNLFNREVEYENLYKSDVVCIGSLLESFLHGSSNFRLLAKKTLLPKLNIIGTGFIGEENTRIIRPNNRPEVFFRHVKIHGLRGHLTLNRIKKMYPKLNESITLGDPGLLASNLINSENIIKKFRYGIVPHYVDIKNPLVQKLSKELPDSQVLNILEDNPIDFIKKMSECENIISSAMHGLIAADSLNIPNIRVQFSNKITGGNYKFNDYYSVFNIKDPKYLNLEHKEGSVENLKSLLEEYPVEYSKVKEVQTSLVNTFENMLSKL